MERGMVMERRFSFSNNPSTSSSTLGIQNQLHHQSITHIIEIEPEHLERLQQQRSLSWKHKKSTSWKRWLLFLRSSSSSRKNNTHFDGGGSSGEYTKKNAKRSNYTVNTAMSSASLSQRSIYNSPSFTTNEEIGNYDDEEEDEDYLLSSSSLIEIGEDALEVIPASRSGKAAAIAAARTIPFPSQFPLDELCDMMSLPYCSLNDDVGDPSDDSDTVLQQGNENRAKDLPLHEQNEAHTKENNTASAATARTSCNISTVDDWILEAQECMVNGEYKQTLRLYRAIVKFKEENLSLNPTSTSAVVALPTTTDFVADSMHLVELANLCYACTRCANLTHDYTSALYWAQRELRYTFLVAGGCPSLAITASYLELARLCRVGMGDSKQALRFYRAAMQTNQACLTAWREAVDKCPDCGSGHTSNTNACTSSAWCKKHRACRNEIQQHIQETKECIGRVYFEMGNMDAALRMI